MDGWEWNKLAAALFGVLTFILAVHLTAEEIFTPAPLPAAKSAPSSDSEIPAAP